MTNEVKAIDPQLTQMREVILQTVAEKYQALVEVINKIPMQQEIKVEAIRFINSGYLWAKEGVSLVTFNFDKEKVAPPEPVALKEDSHEGKAEDV